MPWLNVQGVVSALLGASSTTRAESYGSDVTALNLLVANVTWVHASATCSLTDDDGNTWNPLTSVENTATGGQWQQKFWALARSSVALTVTATFSVASTFRALSLEEFSGNHPTDPFDKETTVFFTTPGPGTGTDDATTSAIAAAIAGSLLFGFMQLDSGIDYGSVGTGFVAGKGGYTFSSVTFGYPEFLTLPDISARATTFTLSTNDETTIVAAIFKPAVVGGIVVTAPNDIQ